MLLSESEAKERWCHAARIVRRESLDPRDPPIAGGVHLVAGVNRDALGRTPIPASCRCLASGCMAWRWNDGTGGRGFCGLADVPIQTFGTLET